MHCLAQNVKGKIKKKTGMIYIFFMGNKLNSPPINMHTKGEQRLLSQPYITVREPTKPSHSSARSSVR